jgi:hypothetical protein
MCSAALSYKFPLLQRHKKAFFLIQFFLVAYFKHLFYGKYLHKIIKKMCFWGNEVESRGGAHEETTSAAEAATVREKLLKWGPSICETKLLELHERERDLWH